MGPVAGMPLKKGAAPAPHPNRPQAPARAPTLGASVITVIRKYRTSGRRRGKRGSPPRTHPPRFLFEIRPTARYLPQFRRAAGGPPPEVCVISANWRATGGKGGLANRPTHYILEARISKADGLGRPRPPAPRALPPGDTGGQLAGRWGAPGDPGVTSSVRNRRRTPHVPRHLLILGILS